MVAALVRGPVLDSGPGAAKLVALQRAAPALAALLAAWPQAKAAAPADADADADTLSDDTILADVVAADGNSSDGVQMLALARRLLASIARREAADGAPPQPVPPDARLTRPPASSALLRPPRSSSTPSASSSATPWATASVRTAARR